MNYKEMFALLARYIFVAIIALPGFFILSSIFSLITIYPVLYMLKLVYSQAILLPGTNIFLINGSYISLIEACVAVYAYLMIIILNFTTPMSVIIRLKSISFLVFSFLLINIVRIFVFTILFLSGFKFFDITHKTFWYAGALFIVFLWFVNIKLFKINKVPLYSDIKMILRDIK
jgi:hypothetical protein